MLFFASESVAEVCVVMNSNWGSQDRDKMDRHEQQQQQKQQGSSLAVVLAPPPLLADHVMLKIVTAPTFCVNHDLQGECVSV